MKILIDVYLCHIRHFCLEKWAIFNIFQDRNVLCSIDINQNFHNFASTLFRYDQGGGRVPKSRHNDLEYPGGRYPNITKKAEYPWGTHTYFYVKMKQKNFIKDDFFMEN